MKTKPEQDTSAGEKYKTFEDGLRQILTVSKSELEHREKEYQASRTREMKRGPKPKR